jgi:hypothetical protein
MKISYIFYAILLVTISSEALGRRGDVSQHGFNLCKKEIQKQYRQDHILLHKTYYIDKSKEDKQSTYYINGRHWIGEELAYDRFNCLTDLNGRALINLDRAEGRYAIKSKPNTSGLEVAAEH